MTGVQTCALPISEFLKGSTPATGAKKEETGSAYATAKKSGDIKGMISAKREAYQNRSEE